MQVTYTRYLPLLAKIGHRFTELSVTSRLAKKQNHLQHYHDATHTHIQNKQELVDGAGKSAYEEEKGRDPGSQGQIKENMDSDAP